MDEIKVYVVKFRDRDNFVMKYIDPHTGQNVRRSTGTSKRREAEKIAAKWEAELQEGRYKKRSRMSWEAFCEQYEVNAPGTLKPRSLGLNMQTLRAFERHCGATRVTDLTTARVTAFAAELRKTQLAEATVARHLKSLKAISRWANRQGYLATVPDFPKQQRGGQRMKGRPITGEEFERMLAATSKVVGDASAGSWKLLLCGLWASGLRLSEAMALRWDQQPGCVCVLLNGKKSVLAFDMGSQKSGKVQLVPLAPEAVGLLEPLQKPAGYVFTPIGRSGKPIARWTVEVGRIITAIGREANVCVNPATGKSASAHDLRRAFGYRWSRRVTTPQLQELMRHSSIQTTLTYYVGQNAETTAQELWEAVGPNLGHTDVSLRRKTRQTRGKTGVR